MLDRNIGGVVLMLLPFIPILLTLFAKSRKRVRILEYLLLVTAGGCLFFAYQYHLLAQLGHELYGEVGSPEAGLFFHYFFDNYYISIVYFCGVVIGYFLVSRSRVGSSSRA